ncbi:MAG: hypothetical protein JWO65_1514 [Sphingomonas bacterium]|jgi:hypothetical protein|nr:hypothetical protein [Sphingomonas bacterium]
MGLAERLQECGEASLGLRPSQTVNAASSLA